MWLNAKSDTEGAVDAADVRAFDEAAEIFFTRKVHGQKTRCLKSAQEIQESWTLILSQRRLVEPDDSKPIQDVDTLAQMHTRWMHEWCRGNLTLQRKKATSRQTSIFNAYLFQNCGGKHLSLIHI